MCLCSLFSDWLCPRVRWDDSRPSPCVCAPCFLIGCVPVPDSSKFSPVEMETLKPLLQLVFHLLDKVTRFQLSKEVGVVLFGPLSYDALSALKIDCRTPQQ